jgi:hypothetical protein
MLLLLLLFSVSRGASIWPQPETFTQSQSLAALCSQFNFAVSGETSAFLDGAIKRYHGLIFDRHTVREEDCIESMSIKVNEAGEPVLRFGVCVFGVFF